MKAFWQRARVRQQGPDCGFALRILRQAHGLTLRQLAERADCPYQHIVRWEQGRTDMGPEVIERMSKALGIKPFILVAFALPTRPKNKRPLKFRRMKSRRGKEVRGEVARAG